MSSKGNSNGNIVDQVIKNVLIGNLIKDSQFISQIFTVFIFVGLLTHLIFSTMYSSTGTYGPATALIWGYSIVFFSIIMVIYNNNITNTKDNIFKIVDVETIILLFYMLWLISINSRYMKKINTNSLPRKFYSYSYISSIIITFQTLLFIFFTTLKSSGLNNIDGASEMIKNIRFINHIFTLLNFILIVIQQIILDNFSVDML